MYVSVMNKSRTKTVKDLVNDFLKSQDVNELSRREYSSVMNYFLRWVVVEGLDFWRLKKADIIRYKSAMMSEGKSVYTISLYLTVIRKLFGFLTDMGYYDDNIVLGVKSPRKDNLFRKKYLTVDKVKELLGMIDTGTVAGKRDYAIISLMVRLGVRRVEVCRMKVGDFVTNDRLVVNLQRKGKVDKDCQLGITPVILDCLNDYLVCRGKLSSDSPLFVTHHPGYGGAPLNGVMISRIVKKYMKKVGLNDRYYTCHSLRHTAAVLSLKAGASIYDVQQMLGHKSIDTTRIYLRAIDAEKMLDNPAIRCLDKLFGNGTNGV